MRTALVISLVSLLNQLTASSLPDLPGLVIPAAAVATAGFFTIFGFARRAAAAQGRYRVGWASAAIGGAAMGLSYLLFGVYALLGVAPTDSPGQVFSVAAGLASIVGVLALAPRLHDRTSRITHLLDVAGVATGMFALTWQLLLAPLTESLGPADQLSFVLIVLPEIVAAALATVLISRCTAGRQGYALHLLAGSLGMFALAAILTTHNAAAGVPWYATGAAAVTAVATGLLVMASRGRLGQADRQGWRAMRGLWAMLPVLPTFAAITAAGSQYIADRTLSPVMMGVLIATVVFTTLRQLLSFYAVARLAGDLEEQRRRLDHLAHHDPLTGLANRTAFSIRATDLVAAAAPDRQVAVFLLDLDGFKPVNDTYGHAVGDQLLVAVADRLRSAGRADDFASRLGGDEFVLVTSGLSDAAEADSVAERIIELVAVPMTIGDVTIDVRTSIGIAVTAVPEKLDSLLKRADDSLYAAKAAGRGRAARSQIPAILPQSAPVRR